MPGVIQALNGFASMRHPPAASKLKDKFIPTHLTDVGGCIVARHLRQSFWWAITRSILMALLAETIFFDIGGTLGEPRLSPQPPFRLEALDVYPYIPAVLRELRDQSARLGIMSNIGVVTPAQIAAVQRALTNAGIGDFFSADLLVWGRKDNPGIFALAVAQAGAASPDRCVFVGEDAQERQFALQAGMRAAPHPMLALAVAEGESLRYVRVTAPDAMANTTWQRTLLEAGVVPLHVTGSNSTVVYAIASQSALARIMNMRFIVQPLGAGDLPGGTDLFLLRDDLAAGTGFLAPGGQAEVLLGDVEKSSWVLASSMEGLHVAVPGGQSVETLHFAVSRHGHNLKLSPDLTLLEPFGAARYMRRGALVGGAGFTDRDPTDAELTQLATISEDVIGDYVDRFSGGTPLNGAGERVVTRHSASGDNALVVDAIVDELHTIGDGAFTVRLHSFSFNGKTLHNVEAEWPGVTPELVIVSAHLDSTAAASHGAGLPPYRPTTDSAPGADDDASGVAAVLAIARALRGMAVDRPQRTIRFVLFNAEEQGLVGSGAYARAQANAGAPIVAVFQMDMIGNNNVPPALFEVHAGYSPSVDVETRSLALAQRVLRLTSLVSERLQGPELCHTKGPAIEQRDGAEGRSDHASFQARGFAACCISEDLFLNDPGLPDAEANEHYHKESDRSINRQYAADIARVVAGSVWVTAHS
jgi:hypothetical protein